MARKWSDNEIEFLKKNYNDFSNSQLSNKIGRSSSSIEKKLKRLGLKKSSRSLSMRWSDKDNNFLKENYSKMTNKELSEILGRSPKTILNRASKMGLSKDKNHLSMISKVRYEENKSNLNNNNNINNKTKDISYKHYCDNCDKGFNELDHLQIHLVKKHNVNIEEYYDNYIGDTKACLYCDNKSKFISLKKGYHKLCNSEECLSKSRAYNSKEWHILNRGNLIEMEYQTQKRLNSLKIGDIKRLKDNPNYYKEKSHNSSLFWMKRGHTLCESIQKSKEVVENMQLVSHKNRKENPDKYSHTYNTKVEYYLERGLSEEESIEALKDRQTTFSKEICIEKYGKEKGIEVWLERQRKWHSNYKKSNFSKISQELFISIWKNIKNDMNDVFFATLKDNKIDNSVRNNEYRLMLKESFILPDFYIPSLNKIIEFDGTYYHRKNIENKKREEIRDKEIEKMGIGVFHVNESEYRKNKKETIQKCIDFLLEKQ